MLLGKHFFCVIFSKMINGLFLKTFGLVLILNFKRKALKFVYDLSNEMALFSDNKQ